MGKNHLVQKQFLAASSGGAAHQGNTFFFVNYEACG